MDFEIRDLICLSFLMLSGSNSSTLRTVVGRRLSEQEKKCTHFIYISVHRRRERLTVVDEVRKVFTGYVTLGFIIG